ncbi:hypothetical protein MBLNU230_g4357t1 [Neophaeotheca triangularis]
MPAQTREPISLQPPSKLMGLALAEARKSPPKPSNFCVGAILLIPSGPSPGEPLCISGYTLEMPGNTHAEQSCFIKAANLYNCHVEELGSHLPGRCELYTTMEPCNKRSAGNATCVERILALEREDGVCAIETVYIGVNEPEKFVGENVGRRRLQDAGIQVVHVEGFEEDILDVATAGHTES